MNPLKKLLLSPESLEKEKAKEKKEKEKAEKEKLLQLEEEQEKELMKAAKDRSARREEMDNRKDQIFSKATIEPMTNRTFLVKGLHTWTDLNLDLMIATLSYYDENTGMDRYLSTRSIMREELSMSFKKGEIPSGGLPMRFKIEIVDERALPLTWEDGTPHFNTFVRAGKFPNSETTKVILDLGKDPEYQEWVKDLEKTEEVLLQNRKMFSPYIATSGVACSAPLASSAIGCGDIFASTIESADLGSFISRERYHGGYSPEQFAPLSPRERTRK